MGWAKLCVRFQTLLYTDVNELHNAISKNYGLSYMGKYVHEGKSYLYIQTSSTNVKMVPNKLNKALQEYGNIEFIGTFQVMEGMLDEEVGEIRNRGRKAKHSPESMKNVSQNNNTIKGDHNSISMDNSVTINLHIHAFGKEDVSHITTAQLDEWIGKKEDIVGSVTDKLGAYLTNELKRLVYANQHEERMEEWESSPPETRNEDDRPEFRAEHALTDPDVESRLAEQIVKTRADDMKKVVIADFARLLYENPHNANVSVNKKSGHFKVFDGHKWDQHEMSRICGIVLDNLQKKSQEAADGLRPHDENFAKVFTKYLGHVWEDKCDKDEEAKKERDARKRLSNNISACIDNEISSVKDATGKKVRRVNTSELECRDGRTWDDLRKTT